MFKSLHFEIKYLKSIQKTIMPAHYYFWPEFLFPGLVTLPFFLAQTFLPAQLAHPVFFVSPRAKSAQLFGLSANVRPPCRLLLQAKHMFLG
jgi:hypothetical protein